MKRNSYLLLALLATACGGGGNGDGNDSPQLIPAPPISSGWYKGPVINGKDYSPGTVLSQNADGTETINIPTRGSGETDGILRSSSVAGKTSIHLKYKVETDGAIVPKEYPQYTEASLALYFQRKGDNWSCAGLYEPYRWYSTSYRLPLAAGTFTLDVPLTDGWTGCQSSTILNNPQGFADAKEGSETVGIAFGGGSGVMHGVFGLGTYTRVTILEFTVQ